MRRFDHRPHARAGAGFAFLWVLLLVALLGLGLTAAVQIDSSVAQRQKERELLSIGRQFRSAIGRYYESQLAGRTHEYPASLEELLKDGRVPSLQRHLRQIFVDPMTGKRDWGLVLIAGKIAGVHSLSERTPMKQSGFDAEDASFAGKRKLSDWVFSYPSDLMIRADPGQPGAAASVTP